MSSFDFGAIFPPRSGQDLSRNAFVVSILFPERISSCSIDFSCTPKVKFFIIFPIIKKADKDLKACPVCDVVWEVMVFNQTMDYKYYHNFPRYGKKKAVCPSCTIRIKNKYYHNSEVLDPS